MEGRQTLARPGRRLTLPPRPGAQNSRRLVRRSEEHTSELQSLRHLVCRLLLEKKKKKKNKNTIKKQKKKKKNKKKNKNKEKKNKPQATINNDKNSYKLITT